MTVTGKISILSDPSLLEKVDKLRELNIGQHVPLPQLVVAGDQSSGKSSLLESLTGIPFPKDQSVCTRHATQITSRRDSHDRVDIRIIPGPRASDEHRKHVGAFSKSMPSGLEFRKQFVSILQKAHERMGLRADFSTENSTTFSEDILKIEVHGPHEDYLTIIDLPGIFRTKTIGTTKEDMVMVKELVKGYIKDERTIILAVLPSTTDVATQEILELAEDYDKDGVRTLGVLTKPDLVHELSARATVCDVIQGKKRPLTLGYFIVRNRGPEDALKEQSELDQTFQLQPWIELPQDRVGIPALKEQLRMLHSDITEREYPKLLYDVNNQIKACKKELDSLGPPRQDEREQRSFLSRIAGTFQELTRAALAADYNADIAFDQDDLRLITHVVNITNVFSAEFQLSAHSRHFQNIELPELSVLPEGADIPPDGHCGASSAWLTMDSLQEMLEVVKVNDITPEEQAELGDVIGPLHATTMPCDDVASWIKDIYLRTRGLDLGTFNANVVAMAFSEQSRKWGDMTKLYMSRVIIVLHRFIASALRSVCPEDQSRRQVWSSILDSLVERYRMAVDQANLLVEVERHKRPYTLNRQFADALSKARGYRITELLRPKARKDGRQYGEPQYMVNLDDIAKVAEGKSNTEQLQEEIHDILRAYYRLALDRFIDNIFQLAVDYSLLHGPKSPLKVFTHEWVINLEPEQLERIVGETKSAKKRRSRLAKKIDDLSNALKILKT
ncbi:P-loop containing nucleoside triphosphate hydrolase protein [Mariannaea sp. PMI_226]|nr:P-loop containing nucleoside triphosphate hydrolase protein [Mariannaea sp. PMI_226]